MSRMSRVEKLEQAAGAGAPVVVVWSEPGETKAEAIAIHEAEHGPIPENAAQVLVIGWVGSRDAGPSY